MDKKCALCGKPLDVFNNSGICDECKNSKFEYNEKVNNYNNTNNIDQEKSLNIILTIFAFVGIVNPVFLIIGLILGKNSLKNGNEIKGYKLLKTISILYLLFIIGAILLYIKYPIIKENNSNAEIIDYEESYTNIEDFEYED